MGMALAELALNADNGPLAQQFGNIFAGNLAKQR
jgi:hypothetical protein